MLYGESEDPRPLLVTGATGMVGRAVTELLMARGYQVRAMTRPGRGDDDLAAMSLELVEGDITRPADVKSAVQGCRGIVHAAALVDQTHMRLQDFYDVNVEGSRNVLEAARETGVGRLIHVSSIAAVAAVPGAVSDEESPLPSSPRKGYAESKCRAEQLVRRFVEDGGDAVIVNPAVIFGPRDRHLGPLLEMYLKRRLPPFFVPGWQMSLVYVDDVANGCVLAYERGVTGRRYIFANPPVTILEFFNVLAEVSRKEPPRLWLPRVLLSAGLAAAWAVSPLTRRRPPATPLGVWRPSPVYDGSRASRELGLGYTPLRRALRDTVEWLRYQGRAPA